MRIHTRRAARALTALGIGALVSVAAGGTASAGQATTVNGIVSCDTTTGQQVIDWTFTFNYPSAPGLVTSAVVDATGLTGGSTVDASANLSPNSGLNTLDKATGTTHATGDAVGDYQLVVTFVPFDTSAQTATGHVTLPGGCLKAATTTTATTSPSTTVAATVDTTAAPTSPVDSTSSTAVGGAGGLPGTGGTSPALPIIGGTLMAMGGALLLVRRRSAPTS